jgi:superfamily II DNA or RNA helicase
MVTATGKTLLGLMAIQKLAADMEIQNRRGTVLIASHSQAILNRWKQEVIEKLGLLRMYGDYRTPVSCEFVKIEFETIQSLIRAENSEYVDLFIIDEVHDIVASEIREISKVTGFVGEAKMERIHSNSYPHLFFKKKS